MTKKLEQAVELLKSGDFNRALSQLNALIAEGSEDPDVYSYRGVVLLNLNRKPEALKDFDKAVDLQPDYSYRYASRAFARDAMGDIPGAIADYEKAIELDPEDAIAHNNLGLLIEKSGNQNAAKKHFDSADKLAEKFFGSTPSADAAAPGPGEGLPLQPQKLKPDVKKVSRKMYWNQLAEVFSSGTEFKQFMRFIFNGFKSKND